MKRIGTHHAHCQAVTSDVGSREFPMIAEQIPYLSALSNGHDPVRFSNALAALKNALGANAVAMESVGVLYS